MLSSLEQFITLGSNEGSSVEAIVTCAQLSELVCESFRMDPRASELVNLDSNISMLTPGFTPDQAKTLILNFFAKMSSMTQQMTLDEKNLLQQVYDATHNGIQHDKLASVQK